MCGINRNHLLPIIMNYLEKFARGKKGSKEKLPYGLDIRKVFALTKVERGQETKSLE
jgi:hypothetical protein